MHRGKREARSLKGKRGRPETSKILAVLCFLLGGGSIVAYWVAVFIDAACDPAVAVQSMVTVVGGLLSYCLYQFGLKNSRNKYGIDAHGDPYKEQTGEDGGDESAAG